MKKLIILLVIVVAIVSGAKFFVESQYEKELDKALENIKMFVDISYDKVKIKLDGSLAVTNVRIKHNDGVDELKIGSLEFNSDNKSYLYKGIDAFSDFDTNKPEFLHASANSVVMDTNGYFYENFGSQIQLCSSSVSLSDIGIDTIEGDHVFEIRFVENKNASVLVNTELFGMEKLNIEASLDLKDFAPASLLFGMKPKMASIELNYSRDEAYADKIIAYCAEQKNISPEEYLKEVTSSPQLMALMGFAPGDGIRQVLRDVLSGKGELRITANPSDQLDDISQLAFYKPEDAVKLLNLNVYVNGAMVSDLSLTRVAGIGGSVNSDLHGQQESMTAEMKEAYTAMEKMQEGDSSFDFSMGDGFTDLTSQSRPSSANHSGPIVTIDVAMHEKTGVVMQGLKMCRPDNADPFADKDYRGYSCIMGSCEFTFSRNIPAEFRVFVKDKQGNCKEKTIHTKGNVKALGKYTEFKLSNDIYSNTDFSVFSTDGNQISKTDASQYTGASSSHSGVNATVKLSYKPDSHPLKDEFMIGDHLFLVNISDKNKKARVVYTKKQSTKFVPVVRESTSSQKEASNQQNSSGFQKIKQSSAKKYIGYTVKVKRKSALELKGELISVSNGQLKIQQRRYGGLVAFPVRSADIKSIEVYL